MDRSTTETRGTFNITDGNVFKGVTNLLTWFNDTTVLVPMTARAAFTLPAEHQIFDQILMGLSAQEIKIQYVESIRGFMNPSARFEEFLAGTLDPSTVGMKVDVNLPKLYADTKQAFIDTFTPPKTALAEDDRFSAEDQEIIAGWRQNDNPLPTSIKSKIESNQHKLGILRYVGSKTAGSFYNERGHKITRSAARGLYKSTLKPFWDGTSKDVVNYVSATERGRYEATRDVRVHDTYVQIGCQAVPRIEIERIAQEMGWND